MSIDSMTAKHVDDINMAGAEMRIVNYAQSVERVSGP